MSNQKHNSRRICIATVIVLVGCVLAAHADAPRG